MRTSGTKGTLATAGTQAIARTQAATVTHEMAVRIATSNSTDDSMPARNNRNSNNSRNGIGAPTQ